MDYNVQSTGQTALKCADNDIVVYYSAPPGDSM
jgi:hypothetical protein